MINRQDMSALRVPKDTRHTPELGLVVFFKIDICTAQYMLSPAYKHRFNTNNVINLKNIQRFYLVIEKKRTS